MIDQKNIRIGAAIFLLFAVIAVDFASKFMSIIFDGVFVALVLVVLKPMIWGAKDKAEQ
ncbi:DUF3927 domain-containing protein [Marinobacterium iners]|uniref:DUF3927 family protein n=1 Tax=Marinobacterium iners TaxID=48076 RepID=UPI001A8E24E9|nr:DUF3927 family protein [Marinobacterium iners]QSR35574.1 DUF3927 domain-containing protein [Marinobacterium iners]